MFKTFKTISAVAIIGAAGACAPSKPVGGTAGDKDMAAQNAQENLTITGKLAYRERIALSPGYVMSVTLSDISAADRKSPVITEVSKTLTGQQVPLAFEITANMGEMQPRNRYAIRATLTDPDGRLAWTTDSVHIVDPALKAQDLGILMMVGVARGNEQGSTQEPRAAYTFTCGGTSVLAEFAQDSVELTAEGQSYTLPSVVSASGAKFERVDETGRVLFWNKGDKAMLEINRKTYAECSLQSSPQGGPLQAASWQVEDVQSGGIIDNANITLDFGADGRVSGSTGCNQYGAEYELGEDNGLQIKMGLSTLRSCPPALMDLERKFLAVLSTAESYQLTSEGKLIITASDGKTLTATRASD